MNKYFRSPLTSFMLAILVGLSSCVAHKDLLSFDETTWGNQQSGAIQYATNITIQSEDLLRIEVSSFDPLAAVPFQGSGGGEMNNMMNQNTDALELFMGYFVDRDGYIDFPVLGKLQVSGLTLEQAKAMIHTRVSEYIKEPVVSIRYLNLKVTVLGEVNKPGTVRMTNKRVTLLEALGMAGDLTSYANRTNILIIREFNGQRTFARLNLKKDDIFTSPFFYLQQNDVVYIEPTQFKTATVADPVQRIVSYSTAGISLISLIVAFSNRKP